MPPVDRQQNHRRVDFFIAPSWTRQGGEVLGSKWFPTVCPTAFRYRPRRDRRYWRVALFELM
jgi:hypothetical protein